jgi:ATP-dependent Clp protease ATP-binding subunit ClpC
MYERFTDRARKVMQLANREAIRLNDGYINTEHLLLGLLAEGSGLATNALQSLGITFGMVKVEVENIAQERKVGRVSPVSVAALSSGEGKLPISPRVQTCIKYAKEEAVNLAHKYIGTEHLLLGLTREKEGLAAHILRELGATSNIVRAAVMKYLGVPSTREDPWDDENKKEESPTPTWVNDLQNGLYRIYWKDNSGCSLAAVGSDSVGRRWFA